MTARSGADRVLVGSADEAVKTGFSYGRTVEMRFGWRHDMDSGGAQAHEWAGMRAAHCVIADGL